ncbi:MAG TPA: hypothetical protein VFJ52_03490 [Terriglobia bacterium]|nr:hypothetical protein [Terriglobia bacterium]HEX5483659.1 hypothetical protein [Terriglobia bacterium]
MIVIRQEQLDVFSDAAVKDFENRMVLHLRQALPQECSALEDEGLRQAIRQSMERAAGYGIVAERDVCKYTEVMFRLGRNFDRDPAFPELHAILNDPTLKLPEAKVCRLVEAVKRMRLEGDK